jgi:quinol monooxygenase YgiN
MVMTILEAFVDRENWHVLRESYASAIKELEPGLVQTYLVQAQKDQNLWRIITVWESQEALTQMRQSGQTPRGVIMFRAASAEPTLTVFQVHSEAIKA